MTIEKKYTKTHERYIELVKYTWCAIFINNNKPENPLDNKGYELVANLDIKDFLRDSGELTQQGLLAIDTMRGVLCNCSDYERLFFDTILQPLNKGRRTFVVQHKDFDLEKLMLEIQYLFRDVDFLIILNDWIYEDHERWKNSITLMDEANNCHIAKILKINERQLGAFNYNQWSFSGLKVFFLRLKDLTFGNVVDGNVGDAKSYLKQYLLAIGSETTTEDGKHKSIPRLTESS